MRSFIAIELSQEFKNFLEHIQSKLKPAGADVRWIEPKNIHLTLKFLGDIDDLQLTQISEILEKVSKKMSRFSIGLSSLGLFPGPNSPRIIWMGIGQGNQQTKEIAQELEEELSRIGIAKEERAFTSHITIGRVKSNLNRDKLVRKITEVETEVEKLKPALLPITEISLLKSTLTPKGPIYEILTETSLRAI